MTFRTTAADPRSLLGRLCGLAVWAFITLAVLFVHDSSIDFRASDDREAAGVVGNGPGIGDGSGAIGRCLSVGSQDGVFTSASGCVVIAR
jgi:hypothetical protein